MMVVRRFLRLALFLAVLFAAGCQLHIHYHAPAGRPADVRDTFLDGVVRELLEDGTRIGEGVVEE